MTYKDMQSVTYNMAIITNVLGVYYKKRKEKTNKIIYAYNN